MSLLQLLLSLVTSLLIAVLVVWLMKQDWGEVPHAYSYKAIATHVRMRPYARTFHSRFHYVLYKLHEDSSDAVNSSDFPRHDEGTKKPRHTLKTFSRPCSSFLFREANSGFSIIKVYPRMFLTEGYSAQMSILANLRQTLYDKGYDAAECANSVWMMTIPGCVGLSTINNVTIYFCYAKSGESKLAIFEEHSHLGERYMHIADHESASMRKPHEGYTHRALLPKNFHLSPLHQRSGYFEYTYTLPVDRDDGSATQAERAPVVRVVVLDENMRKLFFTRLNCESFKRINLLNVVDLLKTHMFSNAWAFTQLLLTGWDMAVRRQTPHYPQPLLSDDKHNPLQDSSNSGFLGLPAPTRLDRYCQRVVEDSIRNALTFYHYDVRLVLTSVDRSIAPVVLEADCEKEKRQVNVNVRSHCFYKSLLVSPNAEYAVNVWGERAEDLFRCTESTLFLQVLESTEKIAGPSTLVSTYSRRAFTKLTSSGLANTSAEDIDFSLDTKPFIDSSWAVSFAVLLIYLQWRVLQVFYDALGMRIVNRSLVPWQPLNKLVKESQERD